MRSKAGGKEYRPNTKTLLIFLHLFLFMPFLASAWPLPDTGQTKCYDDVGREISCPAPGQPFYGQDAQYSINPPSYTKLDASGNALPDNATTWAMVRDNVTGLIWENKTNDSSIHDGVKTFTWCDKNTATNGGNQGTCGTGTGNSATDTEAFINALNAANFGGFSDWRMPSPKELTRIVDLGRWSPSINPAWFPNTVSSNYWSSTTYASTISDAWCVYFTNGNLNSNNKSNAYAVRAVRGGQSGSLSSLVINGDGTVTDTATGLMWQQQSVSGKNWQQALEYAESLTLAGHNDWRLPDISELQSVTDYSSIHPSINTAAFPGTLSSYYWSSTTVADYTPYAWCVVFHGGHLYSTNKSNAYAVRVVRGGQSRLLGNLVISSPAQADCWEIGNPKTIAWETAGIAGNVRITLSRQGGKTGTFTETIADGVPNNGSYAWTVTGPPSVNCVLKIEPLSDSSKGTTQGLFTVEGAISQVWVRQVGTAGQDIGGGVAVDPGGNVYVAGFTNGSFPGYTNAGGDDLFLVKYDASGNRVWTRQYGNALHNRIYGIAADGNGNVYLAGYTAGSLDGNVNAGTYDFVLLKYDSSGNRVWTRQLGSTIDDYGLRVTVDNSGNVLVSGYTNEGGSLDGNTNLGRQDYVLIKYDAAGNKLWTRQAGSTHDDQGYGVATDGAGNVYLTGTTWGNMDGNTSAGEYDIFLVKYDASGNKLWTRQFGTPVYDYGYGVAVDRNNQVYVAGMTWGNLDGNINAGESDLVLIKFDGSGTKLWTRQLGSTKADGGGPIAIGLDGNVYLIGSTEGDFDGHSNTGLSDIYLVKYSPAGEKLWSRQMGTVGNESPSGIALDGAGNIYLTGGTDSAFPGTINSGDYDIFLMKFGYGYDLAVSKAGTGAGTVTGNPAGIDCGSDCAATYASGASITLTASPAANSTFNGWTGCDSANGNTCTVAMNASRSVTALFELNKLTINKSGSGLVTAMSGSLTWEGGAGFGVYDTGTVVTLKAAPDADYLFGGWSGACTGMGSCTVTLNQAADVSAAFVQITPAILAAMGRPLPDTGQTKCYNNTAEIACPSPGGAFYGQDGNYSINPPSYTKLDAAGKALSDDAASWAMVRDNVTGLIWENKTADGSIHDGGKTFTWCDKNSATNGGNQGTCGTGTGSAATDTEAFIKALNDAQFGGFSDWRMPTIKELSTIVDFGRTYPSINTSWFPNTVSFRYWSSTTNAGSSGYAWFSHYYGGVYYYEKTNAYAVRAVRGGQPGSSGNLVMNGDGTVTDTSSGLMWQQGSAGGKNWQAALDYAETLKLAGYDDWRMPNASELQFLVDYSSLSPAIDITAFPDTALSVYWSSTTIVTSTDSVHAYCVHFNNGYSDGWTKTTAAFDVRAVRGGQSRLLGNLFISSPAQADRWEIGSQKAIAWDTAGIAGNVRITLSRQGGKTGTFTETIADGIPNNGSYTWTVTGPASVNGVLKIEPVSDTAKGTTQGLFSITGDTVFRDDFEGTKSSSWVIANPDPSKYNLTENSGSLRIYSTNTDIYGSSNNLVNLFTVPLPTGTDSFEVVAKLRFPTPPYSNYQQGGIVLLGDKGGSPDMDNYIRFDHLFVDSSRYLEVPYDINGAQNVFGSLSFNPGTNPFWLKITKTGDTYSTYYSLDGASFTKYFGPFNHSWNIGHAGIFALNGTFSTPSIPVDFDYFEVKSSGNQNQSYALTVAKSGSGSVTPGSGAIFWTGNTGTVTYTSGTLATLTATPDAGSTFAGWSGDCSGIGVCTLGMYGNRNVTATFNLIPVDTTPPTCTGFSINGGAASTGSRQVTLAAACTDPSGMGQMAFSNDGVGWSAPAAFASTASWTLPAGNASKTVYGKFSDSLGNWTTSPVSATIALAEVTVPVNPTGLMVTGETDGTISLKWNKNPEEGVTYNVFRSQTPGGVYYQVNTDPIGISPESLVWEGGAFKVVFTDKDLKAGQTYYYRIQAVSGSVPSADLSAPVSDRTDVIDDYTVAVLDPSNIVGIGNTVKYYLQLLPRENFKGTLNLTCSGMPADVTYSFVVGGENRGSSVAGVVPPVSVTLQVAAGSAAVAGEHAFSLIAQNLWTGGSSDQRVTSLTLRILPRDGAGIRAEVEKRLLRKGEMVRIYGSIVPQEADRTVTLTLTPAGGGALTKNVKTTAGGFFEDREWISTLGLGSYTVSASWTDSQSNLWRTTLGRAFTVEKGQPVLTCLRQTGQEAALGSDFTVQGSMKPVIAYAPLVLQVEDPDGAISRQQIALDGEGQYARLDRFFTKNGIWKFRVYFAGNAEYIGAESNELVVPVGIDYGRAIILGGGEASQSNTFWEATKRLTVAAYRDLKAKGFRNEMIYYLINSQAIDVNYDDIPDPVVNVSVPTVSAFTDAVKNQFATVLNANTPLFIYMQGHGTSDGRFKVLGTDQYLTAAQLKDALDKLQGVGTYAGQGGTDANVVVIIEACYSGDFIPILSGPRRVILTSAGSEPYTTDASGQISFSRRLFAKLLEGDSVKKAYDYARAFLIGLNHPAPRLDDNGDGVSSAADGLLASNIYLNGQLTWGLKPAIGKVSLSSLLDGQTSTPIAVEVQKGDVNVERVWVQMVAPNANLPGSEEAVAYPEATLTRNGATGLYEGTLSNLGVNGIYKLVVLARDVNKEVSDPLTAYITVQGAGVPGDINGDGAVTLADAILAFQITAGITPAAGAIRTGYAPVSGDANTDNRIGLAEAIYILQKASGGR